MEFANILERAWQSVVTGHGNILSARDIVERWYNKGGDLHQRARRFIRRECLWTAVHYRNTEAVLTRQFRLLAVLLYLEGYFLESDTTGQLPEKYFILLNAPELSSILNKDSAPEVLAAFLSRYPLQQTPLPIQMLPAYPEGERTVIPVADGVTSPLKTPASYAGAYVV